LLLKAHFDPSQYEPLRPGKLKNSAAPTIFSHKDYVPKRKPPTKRTAQTSTSKTHPSTLDHTYYTSNPKGKNRNNYNV
jgi:hypothetical protein